MRRRSISSWKSVIFGAGDLFHGGLEIVPSRLDMGDLVARLKGWRSSSRALHTQHLDRKHLTRIAGSVALMPRSTLPKFGGEYVSS